MMSEALNSTNPEHYGLQTILLALPDVLQIIDFRVQSRTTPLLAVSSSRKRLKWNLKYKASRPYCNYGALSWDVLQLRQRLVLLDASTLLAHDGISNAIRDVLDVLETQLVYPRGELLTTLGRMTRRNRQYPKLHRWIAESKSREVDELADKIEWLEHTTAFHDMPGRAVARLLLNVGKCLNRLPPERRPPLDWSRPLKLKSSSAGNRMAHFCAGLEMVHGRLLQEEAWDCTCPVNHQAYLFAVDYCRTTSPDFVASSIICGDTTYKHSQLEFHRTEGFDNAIYSALCADLNNVAASTQWFIVKNQRKCSRPVKFLSLLGDWAAPPSLTDRIFLAFTLSGLYLHLGGGVWWPYERTGPQNQTDPGIWFTRHAKNKGSKRFSQSTQHVDLKVHAPFFPFCRPGADTANGASVDAGVYTQMNRCMPNLPVLGKMLLEILTWKVCSWDDFETTLDRLASDGDLPHHELAQLAIRMCVNASDLRPDDTSRSIRNDEKLRMLFTEEVVGRFQYILENAFNFSMETLFAVTDRTRDSGVPIGASIADHSSMISVSRDDVEQMNGPSEQTLVVHINKDMPSREMMNDDTFRLETPDRELVQQTKKYVLELEAFQKLLDRTSKSPIKVVVLDTGIDLPRSVPSRYKGDRIRSYSWQGVPDDNADSSRHPRDQTSDAHGLGPGERDPDGHGTHMASIILDIARNCDLYAVQVAGARKDMRGEKASSAVAANIARAIRYAVDTWKVDIISMSCGFTASIPRVKLEIDYAYAHNVLVIAAAGNAGASGGRRWPASDNNVLGIYAATGHGNKYGGNPTPGPNQSKFALLGCAVEGWLRATDPSNATKVRRSGTSHATAVAAGIAAISMQVLRDCKEQLTDNEFANEVAKERYAATEKSLRTKPGMERLFYQMRGLDPARDGYDFVRPWSIVPGIGERQDEALHVARNIVTWCHNVS